MFIQEKPPNIINNSKVCGISNLTYSRALLPSSTTALKTSSLTTTVAATRREGRVWSSIPRTLSLFELTCGSMIKHHLQSCVFIWPDPVLIQPEKSSPSPVHLSKIIRGSCLPLQLPEAVVPALKNTQLFQNLKGGAGKWDLYSRLWKALTYSLESTGCVHVKLWT